MTRFTCEYKSARQEFLTSILSLHQSLMSSMLLVSHEPNTLKISQGMKRYSRFFVNLDMSCTDTLNTMHIRKTSLIKKHENLIPMRINVQR